MAKWINVTSQQDIDDLDETFGGFHDACLRECHIWTNHSVGEDLSMHVDGNRDNNVRLLFQRQFKDPSAIELEFLELARFVLAPTTDNYDSIIESALVSFTMNNELSLYIDMSSASPINSLEAELIVIARKLRWRSVPWLGPEMRYGQTNRDA